MKVAEYRDELINNSSRWEIQVGEVRVPAEFWFLYVSSYQPLVFAIS